MARKPWINVAIKSALITVGFGVYVFVESGTRDRLSRLEDRIDRVETKIDRVDAKVDRVETKVDEVRGYLKFNVTKDQ